MNFPNHIFKGEEHKDISKMKIADVKTVFSHYVENGVLRYVVKTKDNFVGLHFSVDINKLLYYKLIYTTLISN